jgi:GT2 family glycosyltransferase
LISNTEENLKNSLDNLKIILKNSKIEFEIITSIGLNPSAQRNQASKIAKGEWLYFLDDDSLLDSQSIEQFQLALLKFPNAVVFGGPSLLHLETKNNWQAAIQIVFNSDFGVGPLKSRYLSIGATRYSSEKELILCNMIIKSEYFAKSGGFQESLFPNEENEFLSRINKIGEVVYSPLIIVYRNHRNNMKSFFNQMVNYGKGRTRHFLFSKSYNDYFYFIPLLLFLTILGSLLILQSVTLMIYLLSFYLSIILPTCLVSLFYLRKPWQFILSVLAFMICHSGYAFGLLMGFFDNKKKTVSSIKTSVTN